MTTELVKELREKTGLGIVECSKALKETNGNVEEAVVLIRKRSNVSVVNRSSRNASEGIIHSYIHTGGKVGVLIEVNCETDFTAKNEEFVGMVNDICLQIAATNAAFIHSSQVDQETITKETEIAKASLVGKPEHAIAKIVEGKMNKFYSEVCLLEQPFVKDSSKKVKDVISEFAAKTKENIVVKRFVRYSL